MVYFNLELYRINNQLAGYKLEHTKTKSYTKLFYTFSQDVAKGIQCWRIAQKTVMASHASRLLFWLKSTHTVIDGSIDDLLR